MWPDRDGVARGIGGEHVERLLRRDADAAPLSHCEVVVAAMAAERAARAVEQLALALAQPAVAAEKVRLALAGEEAEVLTLRLAGHGEVMPGGDLAHLWLGQLGQREAQLLEHPRRQGGQHVALVLLGVRSRSEEGAGVVLDDAGVVPGDEMSGADALRQVDHGGKA